MSKFGTLSMFWRTSLVVRPLLKIIIELHSILFYILIGM